MSRRNTIHFALAAAVLAGSAGFMRFANQSGSLRILKAPLPILKPLTDLSRENLAPFVFVSSQRLSEDTIQELGTREYINWLVEDGGAGPDARMPLSLSVTYYTGVQDQVPHVPEECFVQGAFAPASDDILDVRLPQLGETVEIRRLAFYPPREIGARTYVYYTICVNGTYSARRDVVRLRMADPRDSHLYYSKVEVSMRGDQSRQGALDAVACRLLDRVLCELVRSHWPPRGAERGPPTGRGSAAGGMEESGTKP